MRMCAGGLTAIQFHAFRFWRHWLTVVVVIFAVLFGLYQLVQPPLNFSSATVVVSTGESAADIAHELAKKNVVRSAIPVWVVLRISDGDSAVKAGTYGFDRPENVFSVIRRLLTAEYGLPIARLTFPEGMSVRQMAEVVNETLPGIKADEFMKLARPYEGYLFPDTYLFQPSVNAETIVETMRKNFDTKIATISDTISLSSRSIADLVIMASILEKEARTEENRKIVSGILWDRLELKMPLQVDAVFGYIFDRDTYSPSATDLKVDSPYNTYKYRGLPPGPINNPGLDTLVAAAQPTKSKYVYYITGNDDKMHYAVTFEGHQDNLDKYLR